MPTILHASWISRTAQQPEATLFLWGEELQPETRPPLRAARRARARTERIPVYSGLVSPAILRHQLRTLMPAELLQALPLRRMVTRLPETPEGTSNGLGAEMRLSRRQVSGIALDARQSAHLLLSLPARNGDGIGHGRATAPRSDLARYFMPGADFRYWCLAARYAADLVRAGGALPVLRGCAQELRVVWEAWSGWMELEANLKDLAALMPGICFEYEPNARAGLDASALLKSFLHAVVGARMEMAAETVQLHSGNGRAPDAQAHAVTDWYQRLLLGQTLRPARDGVDPERLLHDWQAWVSRAFDLLPQGFQLALELREPAAADPEAWTLELGLCLQESGLVLKASEIWARQVDELASSADAASSHLGARLLAGLRVAARLCPALRPSLSEPHPTAAALTPNAAYRFLVSEGAALEQAGCRVTLPAWWTRRTEMGLRLRLEVRDLPAAREETEAEGPETGDYALQWNLALPDRNLSDSELHHIAAAGSPLVYMNERWLQINQDQIEAARMMLRQRGAGRRVSRIQALQLLLEHQTEDLPPAQMAWSGLIGDGSQALQALPVEMAAPVGQVGEMWARFQTVARDEAMPEPPGFVGTLRPYQKRGLAWLWYLHEIGLGACLADDMGLGKTIQTIALFLEQEKVRPSAERWPRLLICPTSVLRNWQRELARFAPRLRTNLHHGPSRPRAQEFQRLLDDCDVVLTSFGTARVDQAVLQSVAWHTLVIDEAQNIKNPTTQQARAIRSFAGRHRLALTGTPLENRLMEIWSILDFLNAGYLGTRAAFHRQFIRPIENERDRRRLDHLKTIVQPFVLRRLKSDPDVVRDLPEKQEINVVCDLSEEQTLLYAQAVERALPEIAGADGMKRKGSILALMTLLKKITNHPAMVVEERSVLKGRSGKLDRFAEMLAEALVNRNQALVFTTFVAMGEILQRHLREELGIDADFLHGGVRLRERQAMVDRFQQGGQTVPVLLLSVRTGGVGINLTAANQVYHYDRWWNPAVENQATDRAHRIGQTRRVQVFKYIMAGTVEEHVDNLIDNKASLAQDILGSGEEWLTELTNDQLYELLKLRYPTV